jgi:anti-sigma regulatory factor (Ser/Thr protein kinase)
MEGAPERLTLSVPSSPRYLLIIRTLFSSLLTDLGFSNQETMAVVLAVNEAYANVIEHCYKGDVTQRIDLTVLIEPQTITIEIRDYGEQPDVARIAPRALHEVRPGGLGTHFMRSVMDEVTYDLLPDTGTLLRMTKNRSQSCKST